MEISEGTVSTGTVIRGWTLKGSMVILLSLGVFLVSSSFDLLERIVDFSSRHETWEIDEIISVIIFLALVGAIFLVGEVRRSRICELRLHRKNEELQTALEEIKALRGIVPICASCKKIRDDQGYWHQVEVYLRNHTDAEFSHGLCPECEKIMYSELAE